MSTQTDPTPYGAGSAYESAYVYAGARPTVMVDPSGKRFSQGGYRAGRNPIGNCGSTVVQLPDPSAFGKKGKKAKPKACWENLSKMYDAVEGIQAKQRDGSLKTQKGLRARARELYKLGKNEYYQTHKEQFEAFYELAKKNLEQYLNGGEDRDGCPPRTDRDSLLITEIQIWWLPSTAEKFADKTLNPDDNQYDPASPRRRVTVNIPTPRFPDLEPIADTP